jgi:hypothetical protein
MDEGSLRRRSWAVGEYRLWEEGEKMRLREEEKTERRRGLSRMWKRRREEEELMEGRWKGWCWELLGGI